ncbi:prepilin-type N-terminal cleavage/methylation domain-containing protein [Cupriavidus necator]|uniref:GspH/FimT family pseudopilin n=1 Tax=Cupriavidus necator TaxID=106590 RepID=UPI00148FE79D|nr:GspH/FimT family pseudopilin [Cupriavidus necator]NOV25520.1 prepilin-type N-terminal cleavage/methylation domain-containing protein [Cupriavidus necator]
MSGPGMPVRVACSGSGIRGNLHRARRGASVSPRASRRHCRGLTLVELMAVVVMVAILAAIGTPSFVSLLRTSRVDSEIQSMVGSLQLARSEAIKRGLPVSVCPSVNGTACLGAGNWARGWIAFVDRNASGTVDAAAPADEVLHYRAGWSATDTFTTPANATFLTYNRDGFAVLPGGALTMTLHTTPVAAEATRCIAINIAGRQTIQRAGEGACQ